MPREYPHLLSVDVPVWEAFLTTHAPDFTIIDYDVRVGEGRDPGEDFEQNIRGMALDLSKRRIDAVGHLPGEIWIMEITTVADMRAIGQLITYPGLYRMTYRPAFPLIPVLICAKLDQDLQKVLAETPIRVYQVNPYTA